MVSCLSADRTENEHLDGKKTQLIKVLYHLPGTLQICWRMLYIKKINRFLLFTMETSSCTFLLSSSLSAAQVITAPHIFSYKEQFKSNYSSVITESRAPARGNLQYVGLGVFK